MAMLPTRPTTSLRWLPWVLGLLGVMAAGAILFEFDLLQHTFYPACPLHQLTGLYCPGCGSLRALHQLAHGHFAEALRLNPPLVMSLPFLFWMFLHRIARETGARPLPSVPRPRRWGWTLVGGVLVFSILRNLPFAPFSRLAP